MLLCALLLSLAAAPERDEPVVPAELQAELLARVLRYDRAFATFPSPTTSPQGALPAERVKVLIVHRESASSEQFARQLSAALRAAPTLGGLPHDEVLVRFTDRATLLADVQRVGARVVLFAPGFAADAKDIATTLEGRQLITVSATPRGVQEGLVLGFDLVDGKPRMLFNLASARRQQSDFRAEVIKLMTVVP